ncbi:DUF305 domain-containing protein [Actinokineospora bangkokensis]|uniref:DUF305 domain-containing protein n=1 Tax=Actinokineospora bangkokensis TaxID=1193682 RepID=A0A1Q9LS88_9PSEU|nr:DUF305 domain-containing protein [Actinokineospora bangkokensis]OLR94854.1 hypothetical protein BJP25_09535 [Actinokineospora bangkokensis]
MRARAVPTTAAALALALLTACSTPEPPPNPVLQPGLPGEPNRTLSADDAASGLPATPPNAADFAYATGMVVHHQQALRMTDLAPTRAANPQLAAFATRIADTQRPEIDMMNRWLTRNGGDDHAGHSGHSGHSDHAGMPGMATEEELAALEAARGPDFDAQFLRLMIRHHEGAVAMAQEVQQKGQDVFVQEMADNIIAEQTDEIARMRAMA